MAELIKGASPHRGHDSLIGAKVSELAEAAFSAGICRILLIDADEGEASQAVALARRLVESGEPTILVDFDGGRTAGGLGLMEPVESIAHIAASPATFAHSIHRDRSSRAHAIAAHLCLEEADIEAVAASMASVLATLEEVYSRTVVVPPPGMQRVDALVHADTAVVVSHGSADEAALLRTLDRLSAQDITDVILIADDAQDRSSGASPGPSPG